MYSLLKRKDKAPLGILEFDRYIYIGRYEDTLFVVASAKAFEQYYNDVLDDYDYLSNTEVWNIIINDMHTLNGWARIDRTDDRYHLLDDCT